MSKNKNDTGLEAIRIEGGVLSSSLLHLLRHYRLPGQTPEDYGIEKGLKLSDELGRYWRIAQARWRQFSELHKRADLDQNTLAVENWLLPLFNRVFGYQVEEVLPVRIGERFFPISHQAFDGVVPFVLTGAEYPLDKGDARFGEEGHNRSPSGLLQEYVNAGERCLWAFVSNGLILRLVRDNPAMTRPAYVEVDLERLFEEELFVDFTVCWLLLQATRLAPREKNAENCFLEIWRNQGQGDGERVLGHLRDGVTKALRTIGTGFVAHPENHELREKIKTGLLSTDHFFQELLRLIYRFLFLLTTEDRGILLDPSSSDSSRNLYRQGYSISLLRERARFRRHHDGHGDAWQQLCITFAGFAAGQPHLAQPALGGLFADDQCPHLDKAQLANRHLYGALFSLCYFEIKGVLSRINYRDMDTEELGSVYESLLELIPRVGLEGQWRFGFVGDEAEENNATGHARKLTGSYYTPDSLVQELIKSALGPVIDARLKENPAHPREALFGISVCDPACGSGHFLLAAARRLAAELAQIDAGADQPTEIHYRHALRDVVSHCIHGVDINPLAVELCRTALWLEAVEPGKPLGFLDAHIQVGNSLVGILDPELMKKGIPDAAFKPLSGDEAETAASLRHKNRIGLLQRDLFAGHVTKLAACAGDLAAMPEEDITQVEKKRDAWLTLVYGDTCQNEKARADLYTAAFFAPKTKENYANVPTNLELAALQSGEVINPAMRRYIASLAVENRFFHWYLVFPEVFEKGGFDVLLGNPPWERIKLQEKEFFASRGRDIAEAQNAASRSRKINALAEGTPAEQALYRSFISAKQAAEAISSFTRESGRFPLTSRGDINLYALFAEHFAQAIHSSGRAGVLVPTGIVTDDSTKIFFNELISSRNLNSLAGFYEIRQWFKGTDDRKSFCLFTIGSTEHPRFIFDLKNMEELKKQEKWFFLTADEFHLLNPNTRTCPVFRSQKDAELTKKIYRTAPILMRDATNDIPGINPWAIKFQAMFHMSNDSALFQSWNHLNDAGMDNTQFLPLYEAKMVHHYDYRWATYETDGETIRDCMLIEKQNPKYQNLPRYWVDSWQVTLRTAQAPKSVLDAAQKQNLEELLTALTIWAAGNALQKGDKKKANALPNEQQSIFNSALNIKQQTALQVAEEWPLDEQEYHQLKAVLLEGKNPWPYTRQLLENRQPRYLLGWRDIALTSVERTVITGIIPLAAVGHTFPLIFPLAKPNQVAALIGNLNSLVFDFIARQKIGGTHLTYGYLKQFPVLPPAHYTETDLSFIIPRVLELSYTSHALKPFAEDLGYHGEPFSFEPERRHQLKCELDAYYARLYHLTRDELRYILDPADVMGSDYPSETFRVLKNKEMNEFGEYRTQRLVLEAWDKIEADEKRTEHRVYVENRQSFPWPGREEFLYHLIPHLVTAREGMDFNYYHDAALLASRPEKLRSLLPNESLISFNALPKEIPGLCFFPPEQHVRSRQLRRSLTVNRKIDIDADSLVTRPGSDKKLKVFESDLSPLIPFIFEATDVLRQFQLDTHIALEERQREAAIQAAQFIQKAAA